jgi:hypothetical protein
MQLVQHVASTDPVLPVFLIRRPSGPIGCFNFKNADTAKKLIIILAIKNTAT